MLKFSSFDVFLFTTFILAFVSAIFLRAKNLDRLWGGVYITLCLLLWYGNYANIITIAFYLTLLACVYIYRDHVNAYLFTAIVLLVIAFAFYLVPGISVPVGLAMETDSGPYNRTVNYHKAVIGLAIYVYLSKKLVDTHQFMSAIKSTWLVFAVVLTTVIVLMYLVGIVSFDPKFRPTESAAFLSINLFFIIAAEELFTRSVIQDYLNKKIIKSENKDLTVNVIMALVFGVLHAHLGLYYFLIGSVLGFGLSYVYQRSRVVEIPILFRFLTTTVLFMFFGYPV